MYEYIKGKLVEKNPHSIVIDVGGVGYKIQVPLNAFNTLPSTGYDVLIYISFIIRENYQAFFGFISKEERSLFEELTSISGIGPKTAMALIGHLHLVDFEEPETLCKVPGIGKKTAERIHLEIKDRLPRVSSKVVISSKVEDALSALMHLGYTKQVAERALKQVNNEEDLAQMITSALKYCS